MEECHMTFWGEGVRAKQFTTISVKVKHKKDKKLFLHRLNLLFHQGNKMHIHGKHNACHGKHNCT